MATLAEIRAQYPQYGDLSDTDLADRLHQKFYADMPRAEFDAKVGMQPQIDFNRPVADVRADVAKLPEGPQRDKAMRDWADAYVAKEREDVKRYDVPGAINPFRLTDKVRNFARGTIVGSFADELNAATNAAAHKVTGGAIGAPYDESIEYQRALDRALDKEAPIESTVTKVAGGLASGAPIAKAVIGTGKTLAGQTVRGAGLGGLYGYAAGFGEGEGDTEARHEKGVEGAAIGMPLGGVLPGAVRGGAVVGGAIKDAVTPTLARLQANASDLPKRIGFPASADGAVPEGVGANAAAQQMLANQLARAGVSVDDLRGLLKQAEDARTFHTSGKAQDAAALVDLDPSLQRLAGSAARASPEAANTAKTFMEARQTGISPPKGADFLASVGIPTRPMLAKPITGKEAKDKFGTNFGAGNDNLVPMGQGERIYDALRRAFLIKDKDWHGHGNNAYRTDQAIIAAAEKEARTYYYLTYRAGRGVDIAPELNPILDKWTRLATDAASKEPVPVRQTLLQHIGLFRPNGKTLSNIEAFDKTKRFLDNKIEALLKSDDKYIASRLIELKNDMLRAMDGIQTNNLGARYKDARGRFGSRMEAQEALQLGRNAWKEDSEIGIDALRSVTGEGHEKLFRLGLLEGYRLKAAPMKKGADKTALFDNERIQDLLREAIPRTQTATGRTRMVGGMPAVFANRPERFGQFIGGEKRMAESPRVVLGGSPTQRNIKDDEAFSMMNKLNEAWDRIRNSGSALNLSINAAEALLSKMFGMRADTAQALARMLFNADPIARQRTLEAVAERLGRNRFEHFTRQMEQFQRNVNAAGVRQAAAPEATE